MSETAADTATDEQSIYTAYEIDFMLSLRPTESAQLSREQVGLHSAPEEAREFVTAAVTSGLRARGKVDRSSDGQWLLGEEGQVVAGILTSADRWLGLALSEGDAMRMAFVIKAGQAVLLLTQDEMDSFLITSLPDPQHVPSAVADIVTAFLDDGRERTASLRRVDLSAPEDEVPLMIHVEQDGTWRSGHLPLDSDGILTVSGTERGELTETVRLLWEDGTSRAPGTAA